MIEITHVSKTFNKGTINEKRALDNLNLKLNEGDFVTVIGGNGAGKSTMLNAIAGTFPVDCGKIVIDGANVPMDPAHKGPKYTARVSQVPMKGTCAGMQIEENLALAKRRGMRRGLRWQLNDEERAFYKEQLATLGLGLETRLSDKVGLLSGGQRQAVTLLMATIQKPRLLLLDEHTAALDPATASKVLRLTREIVESHHLTALMVTHNMKDALTIGNRLIMMDHGTIIYDVSGEVKKQLTVDDLLRKFEEASGVEFSNDRMMLSK